ncbi:MAG: YaaR family protein [Candidatus Coatesbacteria bacterium]
MRVEGTPGQFSDLPSKEPVAGKRKPSSSGKSGAAKPPSFVEELRAAVEADDATETDWTRLIQEVDTTGREVLAHQDEEHLTAYKNAVRAFLTAAVKRAYRVRVVEGHGPNPKLYIIVDRIEGKLDEMTRTVLSAQKNPLALLAQVEELRGLLLDLRT